MRIRARLAAVLLGLVAAPILLVGQLADAKSTYDSHYGFDRTWTAALRLVRVDLGFKVLEKDQETGYVLFEYTSRESAKATSGSLEVIKAADARSNDVRVVAQLPQMPRYHEQYLLDALSRKMRDEYGEAPEPKKDQPPAKGPSDGGTEGGSDDPNQPSDPSN